MKMQIKPHYEVVSMRFFPGKHHRGDIYRVKQKFIPNIHVLTAKNWFYVKKLGNFRENLNFFAYYSSSADN